MYNIGVMKPKEETVKLKKMNLQLALLFLMGILCMSVFLAGCGPVPETDEEVQEEEADGIGPFTAKDFMDPVGWKKRGVSNVRLHIPWEKLQEECPDIIGWIRCKGTILNYPIAISTDNDYYLNTNHHGVHDGVGIPFVDYETLKPFEQFLTVLYGHRMANGTMFKHISYYFYTDGEDHYEKYPIYEFYTPEKDYEMQIFAWARVYEADETVYRFDFRDDGSPEDLMDRQRYLDHVAAINQLQHPKFTVIAEDNIVMMSTCTAQLDTDREVVWAKLVEVKKMPAA